MWNEEKRIILIRTFVSFLWYFSSSDTFLDSAIFSFQWGTKCWQRCTFGPLTRLRFLFKYTTRRVNLFFIFSSNFVSVSFFFLKTYLSLYFLLFFLLPGLFGSLCCREQFSWASRSRDTSCCPGRHWNPSHCPSLLFSLWREFIERRGHWSVEGVDSSPAILNNWSHPQEFPSIVLLHS